MENALNNPDYTLSFRIKPHLAVLVKHAISGRFLELFKRRQSVRLSFGRLSCYISKPQILWSV